MPRLRLGMAAFVLASVLAIPRSADAGIIDFIWEMSGPMMVGGGIACDIELQSGNNECRLVGARVSGDLSARGERRPLWLTLEGAVYFSTGKDSEMRPFKFGHAQLFAYEPTLNLRSVSHGDLAIHHGVIGLSYFLLTGKDFKRFDNVGLKLVPIAVTYKRFTVAYNLRVFPNGFTSQQFGVDPRTPTLHQGREVVNGFTIGWLY
ncbi:MAG: hypothetical protein ABIS29_02870 [Vicinamibacterales bacterium]